MTGLSPAPGPAAGRDERWLWLLFAGAWCLHLHFSLIGWDVSLLSRFQFRQVQTAIAALFFPGNGFPLAYELPLFGPPWAVPLEFPLYQASVAWFARISGLELEPAGRAVSWLYFQSSLPAVFLLLGSAGLRRPLRWITLALLVTSPIYLFFSRCFLIESLAFSASLWFLVGFARLLDRPHPGWLAVCWLAGSTAGAVKVTTWAVFLVAAAIFLVARAWPGRHPAVARSRSPLFLAALALIPPLAATVGWTLYAKAVRDLNPDAGLLNTAFGFWSFGDLAQRFSWDYWRRTTEVWMNGVLSDAGLAVGLLLFVRAAASRRQLILGALAAFLSGQLIFSNLYKVHDYYFYASGVFLIGALGLALAGLFEDSTQPRWLRWSLPVVLVAFQLAAYGRSYLPDQPVGLEPPEYVRAIQDLTDPEDLIIVLGQDWDASTAYYAGRRALMLSDGRQFDAAGIRRSIKRLDPRRVGAVLLFGRERTDHELAAAAFGPLELGATPFLVGHKAQVGIWIPQVRLAAAMDRLPARPYATLDHVGSRSAAGGVVTIGRREISRLREFGSMSPRPDRATGSGFSEAYAGGQLVFNAHAPFELEFRIPAGATRLETSFGLHDGAFADPHNRTDGVTFEVVQRTPEGTDHSLHHVHLDPFARPDHRGRQSLSLQLAPGGGNLLLRAQPGPNGNASFDWSYFGPVAIR